MTHHARGALPLESTHTPLWTSIQHLQTLSGHPDNHNDSSCVCNRLWPTREPSFWQRSSVCVNIICRLMQIEWHPTHEHCAILFAFLLTDEAPIFATFYGMETLGRLSKMCHNNLKKWSKRWLFKIPSLEVTWRNHNNYCDYKLVRKKTTW